MVSLAKVLVIGLDSADPSLLLKWCESGDLPVLQSLKKNGVYGELKGLPAMGDDATWGSFSTTVSPAKHGRYYWKAIQIGSYNTPQFRHQDFKHEPFWADLSRAGRRVAIIDVPKSPVLESFNGIQLSDWLVHGRDRETCSFPPDLATNILNSFGDDKTDRWGSSEYLCRMEALSEDKYELFYQRLIESIEQKLAVSLQLLSDGNWDLFLTVFKESHCAGHQLWHLHDRQHCRYDPALVEKFGNPVKRIYQALDSAIGKILNFVGTEVNVIIFSDLGMGNNYTGESFLDEILLRLESPVTPKKQLLDWLNNYLDRPVTSKKHFIDRLNRCFLREIRMKLFSNHELHPHAHCRAFQLEHNFISGTIRINLKGREPAGKVLPGREMEELCAVLTKDLAELINPDTGELIVERVLRTNLLFDGEHQNSLPDLLVLWNQSAPITAVASPKIGEIRLQIPEYQTGNHIVNGIYFGCGSSVTANDCSSPASIMDIGPTIAMLLNTKLTNTEGKPIAAFSKEETIKDR